MKTKKSMKIAILCLIVLCVFSLTACKEFETGKTYEFYKMEFYCDDEITFEDLTQFVPSTVLNPEAAEIDSIKDLQNFIKEHKSLYSIDKLTKNGTVTLYVENKLQSLTFNDDGTVKMVFDGLNEVVSYSVIENNYSIATNAQEQYKSFRFENGKFVYTIEFIDGFGINYYFK